MGELTVVCIPSLLSFQCLKRETEQHYTVIFVPVCPIMLLFLYSIRKMAAREVIAQIHAAV